MPTDPALCKRLAYAELDAILKKGNNGKRLSAREWKRFKKLASDFLAETLKAQRKAERQSRRAADAWLKQGGGG
jgi:hypothetical protein